MKYYIFRVKDNIGQEYYVLNNQYIGYLGGDHQTVRSLIELGAGENSKEKRLVHQYQVYAESGYITGEHDEALHKMNCESHRYDKRNIDIVIKEHPVFTRSKDKSWYKLHYPNKNSTECHLREMRGTKTIK